MSLHDVLSDYRQAIEVGINNTEISLVFSALRVGGTYVNQNPNTLAFDLLGRLLVYYDSNMGIKELLQQCDIKGAKHSAIVPMFQSFESPRSMLLYVLEDHSQVSFESPETILLYLLEGHNPGKLSFESFQTRASLCTQRSHPCKF